MSDKSIIEEIEEERRKHKSKWSPEHDDGYEDDELAFAAACFAAPETLYRKRLYRSVGLSYSDPWPFDSHSSTNNAKFGKTRRNQLILAVVMIIAEIERLDRVESS
jgi:hypothetical protein